MSYIQLEMLFLSAFSGFILGPQKETEFALLVPTFTRYTGCIQNNN